MVKLKNKKQQLNKLKLILRGKDSQNTLPYNALSKIACRKTLSFGFSLAEVLIAMLIMSVFYLATTKVVTVKQKPQVQENPHGYYECYNKGGLKERRVDNGRITIEEHSVANCTFRPINGLPFYNIYIVDPVNGFYSNPEAQINDDPQIQFHGASGLIQMYQRLEADIGLSENQNIYKKMADQKEVKFEQFRGYLKSSHPNSMLAQDWVANSVNPPYSAVFIVW